MLKSQHPFARDRIYSEQIPGFKSSKQERFKNRIDGGRVDLPQPYGYQEEYKSYSFKEMNELFQKIVDSKKTI